MSTSSSPQPPNGSIRCAVLGPPSCPCCPLPERIQTIALTPSCLLKTLRFISPDWFHAQIPTWMSNRHLKPHTSKTALFYLPLLPAPTPAFTTSGKCSSTLPAVWAPNAGVILDSSCAIIPQSQPPCKSCQLHPRTLYDSNHLLHHHCPIFTTTISCLN